MLLNLLDTVICSNRFAVRRMLQHVVAGDMVGGHEIRRCTSRAPASRIMRTILRLVVPRHRNHAADHALPFGHTETGFNFGPDSKISDGLRGLDESTSYVMIADESACLYGIPDSDA